MFENIHILLPQTCLRLMGLPVDSLRGRNLIQYEFVARFGFTDDEKNEIYSFSKYIAEILGMNYKFSPGLKKLDGFQNDLIDCHLVNLRKYYFETDHSQKTSLNILDYSSLGHRSLLNGDRKNTFEYYRAKRRNQAWSNQISPKLVVHWDDWARNRSNDLSEQRWKHLFIDSKKVQENVKKINHKILNKNKNFRNFDASLPTIIFLPHISNTATHVNDQLPMIAKEITRLAGNSFSQIIVKPHRASKVKLPDFSRVDGKPVFSFNETTLRNLPVETLHLAMSNTALVSYPSSALFSYESGLKYIILSGNKYDQKEYGLMLRRRNLRISTRMNRGALAGITRINNH